MPLKKLIQLILSGNNTNGRHNYQDAQFTQSTSPVVPAASTNDGNT
jgi:hypothetical protein